MRRSAILWALAMLVGMAFIGFGLAIGGIYFAALIAAMVLAVPLLLMPLEQILWGGWVLTYLVAGQLEYFGHISKAPWLPYLFCALLFLRLPIDVMSRRNQVVPAVASANPLKKWVFVFLAIVLFTTAVNAAPVLQILVALKEYLFTWSILIVSGLGYLSSRYFAATWKAMLWLVPLHVPIVIYQRFWVAAARKGNATFDSVVGLFGGDSQGGGSSGAMGMFLLFALLLAIALWRAGKLRTIAMAGICISVAVSVLLADVKFIILLLPIGIALLYRNELLRRPFRALIMLMVSLALAAGLSLFYQAQFGNRYNANKGPFGYIERAIELNLDSENYARGTGDLGRIATLNFWWKQHGMDDPLSFLVGHGIGSTRYGTIMGQQALQHRYVRIDGTAAAIFLWETGLLGLVSFVGFLVAAARLAARLSKNGLLGLRERAVLAAIAPMLLVQPLSLIYNTDLCAVPQMQILLMLIAGQALLSHRRAAARSIQVVAEKKPRASGEAPSKALSVA